MHMKFKVIDKENWKRSEYFDHYYSNVPCTYTMTVKLDITKIGTLTFEEPVRAVTPGQAVVLYDGDYVLGGGTICRKEKED